MDLFSKFFMVGSFELGRNSRMCVIWDSIRLLYIVILPYGVRFLGSHGDISLSTSISFLSTSLTLKVIPSDSNSDIHICSLLLHDFIL